MKINIKALLIVYIGLFLCLNLVHCSSMGKIAPEYKGVDPRAEHFVKEFKEIAQMQGITFKHEVTVGFKKINDGSTIGLTSYGQFFREIDLDQNFWDKSTEITREALSLHELTHAYCGRGHTWGNNIPYPEYSTWKGKEPKEGRYRDGTNCPRSLMFPEILDDFCTLTHFNDYIFELYNNCEPF